MPTKCDGIFAPGLGDSGWRCGSVAPSGALLTVESLTHLCIETFLDKVLRCPRKPPRIRSGETTGLYLSGFS